MLWDVVHAAFADELMKIGQISLAGLSPQTVLERSQPAPPMETAGLSKALAILDRYEAATAMPKVAAPRIPFNPNLPEINTLTGAKKKRRKKGEEPAVLERSKSLAGHTLGGMGIGRLAGEISHGPTAPATAAAKQALHGKRWYGAVIGGGVGAAEFARKRIAESVRRKRELQKAAAVSGIAGFSPAQKLKAERQTGALGKTMGRFGASGPSALTRIAKSSFKGFP